MTTTSLNQLINQAQNSLKNAQPESSTPDIYRELCLRKLSLRIAQVVHEIKDASKNINLKEELNLLITLTEPLKGQESFASTAADDQRRSKTLTENENLLFSLLREISWKVMLIIEEISKSTQRNANDQKEMIQKLIFAAQQVAISNVRFSEQCTSNPIVKNSHVKFARVTSFVNLAIVEIAKNELKNAEENLAKARFSWGTIRNRPNDSILTHVGIQQSNNTGFEDLDYLGVNILHVQGLLKIAQNDLEGALKTFGLEIISSSRKYTKLPYVVGRGYFQMAKIFFKQERVSEATSYFTRTAELWYNYLSNDQNDENSCEKLSFVNKQVGIMNLKEIIERYSAMSEHVRNRNECLEISRKALELLLKL